jgi:phenylalanyl-tRNA synthetase beta chain
MRLPVSWLSDWVDIPWAPSDLSRRLTASGFEVEGVEGTGPESVLELKTYANRGDSMSVLGVAREVAALTGGRVKSPDAADPVAGDESVATPTPVLEAPAAAPRFLLRRLEGLDNHRSSPEWMVARLERAGLRSISPVVDVTNYVLLELGQPMHAYDASRVQGTLRARMARAGETLTLLDERTLELADDVLVIADDRGAVGMAGVMGGQGSSITEDATDVLLEVAYFSPAAIAGRGRRHGLATDASQRFERGVDPHGQQRAMERATSLLLQICGGKAGPVREAVEPSALPQPKPVRLRRARLARVAGAEFEDQRVVGALKGLGLGVADDADGWTVTPPSWRFDLSIESDLIEEVLRIIGFDAVRESPKRLPQRFRRLHETRIGERALLDVLTARGYHECINYAFVDPALQEKLFPGREAIRLANPIASDLAVMRVSLWPALIRTALTNTARQQDRVRLFELGAVFDHAGGAVKESPHVAGLITGTRFPEQWGTGRDAADFFDLKADVSAVLQLAGNGAHFDWQPTRLACLHPGRGATIVRDGREVGWVGELHPQLAKECGFDGACLLFELDITHALQAPLPTVEAISRYPHVRRDLAVTVPVDTPLSAVISHASVAAGELLTDLKVFDIYQGVGIEPTRKSVALGLIFQDKNKTLTDAEADALMASVAARLGDKLDARVRS